VDGGDQSGVLEVEYRRGEVVVLREGQMILVALPKRSCRLAKVAGEKKSWPSAESPENAK